MSQNNSTDLNSIMPWDDMKKDILNVIVDTPRGSRNKYEFDAKLRTFQLGGVMPLGNTFPFDFGFIPQTVGGDDDPLDVLILIDEPVFTGCLVKCRPVGGLLAYQTEKRRPKERNDRLIAVAEKSLLYEQIKNIRDINPKLLEQIKHFFISYNEAKGKLFEIKQTIGPEAAIETVRRATVTGE